MLAPWLPTFVAEIPSNLSISTTSTLPHVSQSSMAKRAPPTTSSQEQSLLLGLPPEMRNRIYDHVFSIPGKARIVWRDDSDSDSDGVQRHSVLALLQTCRLVHEEAECIFYQINHFYLDFAARSCFLSAIFPINMNTKRSGSIQEVTILVMDGETATFILRQCTQDRFPKLRKLHLQLTGENQQRVGTFVGLWEFVETALRSTQQVEEIRVIAPDVGNEQLRLRGRSSVGSTEQAIAELEYWEGRIQMALRKRVEGGLSGPAVGVV